MQKTGCLKEPLVKLPLLLRLVVVLLLLPPLLLASLVIKCGSNLEKKNRRGRGAANRFVVLQTLLPVLL